MSYKVAAPCSCGPGRVIPDWPAECATTCMHQQPKVATLQQVAGLQLHRGGCGSRSNRSCPLHQGTLHDPNLQHQ